MGIIIQVIEGLLAKMTRQPIQLAIFIEGSFSFMFCFLFSYVSNGTSKQLKISFSQISAQQKKKRKEKVIMKRKKIDSAIIWKDIVV